MSGAVNVALRWTRAGGGASSIAAGIGDAVAVGLTAGVSVSGNTAPAITSPSFLVAGTVNTLYPTTYFTATGSTPITWTVTGGTLPAGMTFTTVSNQGVLAGTPTATSSGSITFTATNALGLDNRSMTLTVSAAGVYPLKGPWNRPSVSTTAYPATQHEWDGVYSSQPLPATSGTRKVEIRRGGTLIYSDTRIKNIMNPSNSKSLQTGDEVWVYPAVYDGVAEGDPGDSCAFGNETFVPGGWYAQNIKVKGITIDGFRPVIKYRGGSGSPTGGSIVTFVKSSDCIFENIDIDQSGADALSPNYLKSAVYFFSMQSGTATLKDCRIVNNNTRDVNGAFASVGAWAGDILIENCYFSGNGGGAGPEHNVYLNYPADASRLTSTVTVRGCFFGSVKVGHHFKSRLLNNVIEGNYFMGTQRYWAENASADSFLIDLTGGGNATVRNNIFVKTFTDAPTSLGNLYAIGALADKSAPVGVLPAHVDSYPGTNFSATVSNNTFVSYSSVVSSGQPCVPYYFGGAIGNWTNPTNNFPVNQTFTVRDNVYVGIQPYGAATLDWYRSDSTSLLKTWADDAIHAPGSNTGAAFSLKTASASSGAVGGVMYSHQSAPISRTDTNKGARG